MFNPQKISKLINERKLIDKKFTLTSLYPKIGITGPGLNDIIIGKSIPKVTTLEAIAIEFGVDMNYFFDLEEKKTVQTEHVKIIDGNEYILRRFEEVIQENAILKHKLEAYELDMRENYSMQNVPNLKVAEHSVELKKK